MMFYINLLTIRTLSHKIYNAHLHVVAAIDFPQSTLHLNVTLINRIPGGMGFFNYMVPKLTTFRIHN